MEHSDLNEDELEELDVLERLYSMLHHTDDTQQNVEQNQQNHSNTDNTPSIAPKTTVRRYWHSSDDQAPVNTTFQKVNPQKPANTTFQKVNPQKPANSTFQKVNPQKPANTAFQKVNPQKAASNPKPAPITKNSIPLTQSKIIPLTKPKEEKTTSPKRSITSDLLSFGSPLTQDAKTTIKIIDNDDAPCLDLETSDEDEVVEVALPQKPTITIESSDEDEISIVPPERGSKTQEQASKEDQGKKRQRESNSREVSASPVPSVVSSVSDDFIRGDCIALNISSRRADNPSFDFSLHGSDLLDKPSKKKKKKKNKERDNNFTANTTVVTPEKTVQKGTDDLFATPKNKAKNKKQKAKPSTVAEKIIPNIDIYDSDSNQSFDINKKQTYAVTDKSLPCADVYESDSSQSEITKITKNSTPKEPECNEVVSSESSVSLVKEIAPEISIKTTPKSNVTPDTRVKKDKRNATVDTSVVDLTDDAQETILVNDTIEENIFMANVTGFEESDDYGDNDETHKDANRLGSSKVPSILFSDLDFNNLKLNEKVCKKRCYSVNTLRDEMQKFYNESWGGEDFNHRAIQKTMSRDKSLWEIDPKDRMLTPSKRTVTCNYCNRFGHRDDTCRRKPPICYMCGNSGHNESRCPQKICVNCSSPNHIYTNTCRNCNGWGHIKCAECNQMGHPSSHCPDLWRRYHNTIDNNSPLAQRPPQKNHQQMFCSGCARRGHLVHTCRVTVPFSGLPINSPYVVRYKPLYPRTEQHANDSDKTLLDNHTERVNKRQSKSPVVHETHVNKKRHLSSGDNAENRGPKGSDKQVNEGSPQPQRSSTPHKMRTQSENDVQTNVTNSSNDEHNHSFEKALDYIAITPQSTPQRKLSSSNHDKKGQIIQDNEVSDTSDVRTSAKMYVPNDVLHKLKTKEGEDWLKETCQKHNVEVTHSEMNPFLDTKGRLADQEAFQAELRNWNNPKKDLNKSDAESAQEIEDPDHLSDNIPKNRYDILRYLSNAFDSLKAKLGDPKKLYKDLKFHQRNHYIFSNQRIVRPEKLSNATDRINEALKKLNLVLLGQAGLGDGSTHLNELYSLQQQLSNQRNKSVTLNLRKEIGLHYQPIFTALPRNDYPSLIKKYNLIKSNLKNSKANRKLSKKKQKKLAQPISNLGAFGGLAVAVPPKTITKKEKRDKNVGIHKLKYYHRRLMIDVTNPKKGHELARKFHVHISSFDKEQTLCAKAWKKIRKLEKEAKLFLNLKST